MTLMTKGIIFDLDGTLVNSLTTTFDAFNHGITLLGGRTHTPQEIMDYFGTGENQIFAQILGPDKADAAYAACFDYFNDHLGKMPLHEGIPELLNHTLTANIPISIVTGRSWDTTEIILKHHGLINRFVTIVANDHVSLPKPAPEGTHLALSRMGLHPQEVLFVGDSPADMIASRSAGSRGVAALWDLTVKRELLEPHTPHHWAHCPSEVWEYWQKLTQ